MSFVHLGSATVHLLLWCHVILRKLALTVHNDNVVIERLIHHCLDRLAVLVVVLALVRGRLHIDALLFVGGDDHRVVQLGCLGCTALAIDRCVVGFIVIHAGVILSIERLAKIDLEGLQTTIHHLRALRHHTLHIDVPCICWCVSKI